MSIAPEAPSDRRVAAWSTLSELFVGRELTEQDLQHMASALEKSRFSADELERILTHEVTPVLRSNVGMLAIPEMLGWDPNELRALIVERLTNRRSRWDAILFRRKLPELVRDRWHRVRHHLDKQLSR